MQRNTFLKLNVSACVQTVLSLLKLWINKMRFINLSFDDYGQSVLYMLGGKNNT